MTGVTQACLTMTLHLAWDYTRGSQSITFDIGKPFDQSILIDKSKFYRSIDKIDTHTLMKLQRYQFYRIHRSL